MKSLLPFLIILVIAPGCASVGASDKSAQAAYEAIEDRLLSAPVLRVDYTVDARGALVADIEGDLVMQKPALAAISASGVFAGSDVTPLLVSNGAQMRGGNARGYFDQAIPADLRDGLLLGLMRMGILHNIAVLSGGAAPEGTGGDVRDWVVVNGFAWRSGTRRIDNVELRGIGFSIEVGGESAGDAVLWYDPVSGLPVEREQVVRFEGGDMRVVERYAIVVDGIVGACRFDLDTLAVGR